MPVHLATVVVVVAMTGVLASTSLAAAGGLDPAFGTGGLVTTSFPGWDGAIQAVTTQSDGKIVAAGWVRESLAFPPPMSFVVARYNPDGTLDSSFAAGGVATTKVGSSSAANAVAIQADGKIVAGGFTWDFPRTFALARFTPDGALDATFGSGGKVITNVGFNTEIKDIALQTDGKLVVGGANGDAGDARNFIVTRYLSNGSLDTTFGSGGTAFTNFFGRGGMAERIVIQPDGKIVEVGSAGLVSYPFDALALVRFNADGTLDTTFGTAGKVTTSGEGGGSGSDVLVQPDGKLVAAGAFRTNTGHAGFGLARYNIDGSPDTSFGTGGAIFTDFGNSGAGVEAVSSDVSGRIVAAGTWVTPSIFGQFAVARYAEDGSLDTSFGSGGKVTTDFGGASANLNAAVIQADGNIVAGGVVSGPSGLAAFGLARYLGAFTDTMPPQITVPADMTVDATSPTGAVVEFTATATDEDPSSPTVTCSPPPGAMFPINSTGDVTVVECSAVDAAGNSATAHFAVHVSGASEQLRHLHDRVVNVGPGTSLGEKVGRAQDAAAAKDIPEACAILNAFISQVTALSGKNIGTETATTLITDATRIRAVLGC